MTSSRRLFTLASVLLAAGTLTISGCSSSTTSEEGDATTAASAPTSATESTSASAATEESTDATAGATQDGEQFTLEQVAQHNTSGDCWTAIEGKVYDLTDWEDQHPGGAARIQSLCGIDGSSLFNAQHDGQSRPESVLDGYQIGVLAQG